VVLAHDRRRDEAQVVDRAAGQTAEAALADRDRHGRLDHEVALLGHAHLDVHPDRAGLVALQLHLDRVVQAGREPAQGGHLRHVFERHQHPPRKPDLDRQRLDDDLGSAIAPAGVDTRRLAAGLQGLELEVRHRRQHERLRCGPDDHLGADADPVRLGARAQRPERERRLQHVDE
jgi:hypothetical protein